jgi:hypothetical protein
VTVLKNNILANLKNSRIPTRNPAGKVFYQQFPTYRDDQTIVPTPIFVMSFDAIVSDAAARNHTFLEILRSATKNHSKLLSGNADRDDAPPLA